MSPGSFPCAAPLAAPALDGDSDATPGWMAAGAGAPASVALVAAWPSAGLMGFAVTTPGTALVAGAGAGNPSWLVPKRESRFVRLCRSARRLSARSLVPVLAAPEAFVTATAALVAAAGLSLVAARAGASCA